MTDNSPDIIIIKGAPGSGKSTTAKELSKLFPKGVRIEVDTIRQMVISVDWKNQEEHIKVLDISIGMIRDFLRHNFAPVILVDTFSGNKIKKYLETLNNFKEKYSIKIFGLFVSEDELKQRVELRSEDQFRDFEICRKLNSDVTKFKTEGEILIDTTKMKPSQTAEMIWREFSINMPLD